MVFDLKLRPAVDADRSFVTALEKQVMYAYAVALWGKWNEIDPASYDMSEIEIVCLDAGGSLLRCGCLMTRIQDGCYRIAKIYLTPDFQGRNIGKQLLNIAKKRAAERKIPLQLSVLTTNPAHAFYVREGLVEVARTPERILMQWGA